MCYDDDGDDMGKGVICVQEALSERGKEFPGVVVDGINCGCEDAVYRSWVKVQKGKIIYHLWDLLFIG